MAKIKINFHVHVRGDSGMVEVTPSLQVSDEDIEFEYPTQTFANPDAALNFIDAAEGKLRREFNFTKNKRKNKGDNAGGEL